MKQLHRSDLFMWSEFNTDKNIDFNGICWIHPEGNVLIDPVPMSQHDQAHLKEIGGAKWIIITNSDHIRESQAIQRMTGAQLMAPVCEQETFRAALPELSNNIIWLSTGDEPIEGLQILEIQGSKTSGELGLILNKDTVYLSDLIRAHQAGELMWLPSGKLKNPTLAKQSARQLLTFPEINHVLVGDGWPLFHRAQEALARLWD